MFLRNASGGVLIEALIFSSLASGQVKNIESEATDVVRTATLIGVLPQINQLYEVARHPANPLEPLSLHQEISEKVLAAALQVDATTAQIDNEIAQANELRGFLADRRDRTVSRANLLSVVAGGSLGASSAGLQLPSGQNKPSSIVGIAAGVVSTGLAVSGIHAQKVAVESSTSIPTCWLASSTNRRFLTAATLQSFGSS